MIEAQALKSADKQRCDIYIPVNEDGGIFNIAAVAPPNRGARLSRSVPERFRLIAWNEIRQWLRCWVLCMHSLDIKVRCLRQINSNPEPISEIEQALAK